METQITEEKVITQAKRRKKRSIIIGFLGILLLVAGFSVGILLVRQNQKIQEKAATPSGTVKVFLSPETRVVETGQTFSVNILLDTSDRRISALTIDLGYPYTEEEPPITVKDIQINSSLVVNNNWDFPIKYFSTENQMGQIRIGGLNSSSDGYKTDGEENIATITFEAKSEGKITLTFNPTTTKATDKTTGEDILLTPSSVGNYSAEPTKTTPTTIATTSPNPLPTPTIKNSATPKPTQTPYTPIPATSPTPTPMPPPESGVSLPTILGIGSGVILLIGSLLLAI